jgi:hypothetical protein
MDAWITQRPDLPKNNMEALPIISKTSIRLFSRSFAHSRKIYGFPVETPRPYYRDYMSKAKCFLSTYQTTYLFYIK